MQLSAVIALVPIHESPNSQFNAYLWTKSDTFFKRRNVRLSVGNISVLQRKQLHGRLPLKTIFQQLDISKKRRTLRISNVEQLVGGNAAARRIRIEATPVVVLPRNQVEYTNNAFNDI